MCAAGFARSPARRDERGERDGDAQVIGCGQEVEAELPGTLGGGRKLGPRAARQVPDSELHIGLAATSCRRPATAPGSENIAQ
jgi:hypothetical protein